MVGQFVKVCAAHEVQEGHTGIFSVNGKSIMLAKERGTIYALESICSHDGGYLGEGKLAEGQIECPRHGARFDIKTGEATRMPAIVGIAKYEVKVEDETVYVALYD